MNEFDELISTLEVVGDAVWAKDKDQAFEAITICLLQSIDVLGQSKDLMETHFRILEETKDFILSEDYEDASACVLAMLVGFRQAKEEMEGDVKEKSSS